MKWQKLGRIYLPQMLGPDRPRWLTEFAQCPATLVLEDRVRVFFSSREPRDAQGQYAARMAYLDLARDDLTKVIDWSREPLLELGDPGCFDEHGTYPACVVKSSDNVTLLYYAGWRREVSVPFDTAIGVALSDDDGQTFVKFGRGPVLGASPSEPFVISGPKVRQLGNRSVMFYIAGYEWVGREVAYRIRSAVNGGSFAMWLRSNVDLIPTVLPHECQAGPDVFLLGGKVRMLFSYRAHDRRDYHLGYAETSDPYTLRWTRDDTKVGLGLGEPGEFDDTSQTYPHFFELDGQPYLLYNGNEVGRWGIGLAKLEQD